MKPDCLNRKKEGVPECAACACAPGCSPRGEVKKAPSEESRKERRADVIEGVLLKIAKERGRLRLDEAIDESLAALRAKGLKVGDVDDKVDRVVRSLVREGRLRRLKPKTYELI